MTMQPAARPRSLFRSTVTTLAAVLLVLQLVMVAATVNYVVLPMAKRSADDLAALLVLSAQTWVELPPETRQDFELELIKQHHFMLFPDATPLPPRTGLYPYLDLLDEALSRRTGTPISTRVTDLETVWFWAEIAVGGHNIRVGFPKSRLTTDPTMMLLLALLATLLLTPLTALILARRITRPLAHFSRAAERIGEGNLPEALPDSGIEELSSLVHAFNRMALQVRELLANRTTLLAGISHDLRTPLARMRLAIEMLPQNVDQKLLERLRNDIGNMNVLIGEFLALSRDLQKESPQTVDLDRLLPELAAEAETAEVRVECRIPPGLAVQAGPVSLRRILLNLISNAVRYGNGKPVLIEAERTGQEVLIHILDRGAGIPPEEIGKVFRPFYRLEASRSQHTGGSGLGLAIARQLSEANGWKVELLARADGGTDAVLRIRQPVPGLEPQPDQRARVEG